MDIRRSIMNIIKTTTDSNNNDDSMDMMVK